MKWWMSLVVVAAVLVMVGIITAMTSRNVLSGRRQVIDRNWTLLERQLQPRFDLITNLAELVRSQPDAPAAAVADVARYRGAWDAATSVAERVDAANGLERTLAVMLLAADRQPALAGNAAFTALKGRLAETDAAIAPECFKYNNAVAVYTRVLAAFPMSAAAEPFGFTPWDRFFGTNAPTATLPLAPDADEF